MGNGNLSTGLYANSIAFMTAEDSASVSAGNYPIILIKEGEDSTKLHISIDDLSNYDNVDATQEGKDAEWAKHGYAVPIVRQMLTS
jgi:hypothetical protein